MGRKVTRGGRRRCGWRRPAPPLAGALRRSPSGKGSALWLTRSARFVALTGHGALAQRQAVLGGPRADDGARLFAARAGAAPRLSPVGQPPYSPPPSRPSMATTSPAASARPRPSRSRTPGVQCAKHSANARGQSAWDTRLKVSCRGRPPGSTRKPRRYPLRSAAKSSLSSKLAPSTSRPHSAIRSTSCRR